LSKVILSLVLSTAVVYSTAGHADVYVNTGAYFSKAAKPVDQQGAGTGLGIGYELNKSWSVELSYDKLIDKSASRPTVLKDASPYPLDWENSYQSKGLILSALGKTAINPSASLFYRIGVMYSDLDYSRFSAGKVDCAKGVKNIEYYEFINAGKLVQQATGCYYADKSTELLLGLGVETNFNDNWFGRIEANHFFANKGEAITAAKLSVGYKF
jgi:opacity protein-like surface antigen